MPGEHVPEHAAVVLPPMPYVPAGHSVHDEDVALPVEYEPAGHGAVHADVVSPVVLP